MRILLDTHVFLWYITGDPRLASGYVDTIRDPVNVVCLSVISVWEAVVKYQLGKLPLPEPPELFIPHQRERHRIEALPLDESAVGRLPELPALHKDPFDRMLICQAMHHGLTLLSLDAAVGAYSGLVSVLR